MGQHASMLPIFMFTSSRDSVAVADAVAGFINTLAEGIIICLQNVQWNKGVSNKKHIYIYIYLTSLSLIYT